MGCGSKIQLQMGENLNFAMVSNNFLNNFHPFEVEKFKTLTVQLKVDENYSYLSV